MKINSQLERAQLENVTALPTAATVGRIAFNTVDGKHYLDDSTTWRAMLRNDGKIIIGNDALPANNVRFHRGASGLLQVVLGGDTTAEGTFSNVLAQVSLRHGNFTSGTLPTNSNAGRIIYVTDTGFASVDSGSAWKVLVDTTGTQTISGKTLTSPTINSGTLATPTITGGATHTQTTTPAAPSAGTNKFYFKSDGFAYTLDSAGIEVKVGSGTGGLKNYITGGDFEGAIPGSTFVNGTPTTSTLTGGAPTATITASSTSPLSGIKSGIYTPQATIGAGWSTLIATDREDLGLIQQGELSYEIATPASYNDGDLVLAAYDVTNGAPIPLLEGSSVPRVLGPSKLLFRVALAYNSQSYRIGFVQATTNVAYGSVKFEVKMGPQLVSRGAPIVDGTYAPVITGAGTVSSNTSNTQRVGRYLYVQGTFVSGTVAAARASISLPPGLVSALTANTLIGEVTTERTPTNSNRNTASLFYNASNGEINLSNVADGTNTNNMVATNGNAFWGSGTTESFWFKIPILGWSSNVVMSSDSDNRPVLFSATGSPPVGTISNSTYNLIAMQTVTTDSHGGYIAGQYKIQKSGFYDLYCAVSVTGSFAAYGGCNLGFQINSSITNYRYNEVSGPNGVLTAVATQNGIYLAAGTLVTPIANFPGWTSASFTSDSNQHNFSVKTSNSGAQQIAATETVAARYYSSSGQSIPSGTDTVYVFGLKDFDTHGAMNTSTGEYTVPANGTYLVSSALRFQPFGLISTIYQAIYIDGSIHSSGPNVIPSAAVAGYAMNMPATLVRVKAGQKITVIAQQNTGSNRAMEALNTVNWINIIRMGGY